MGQRIHEEEEVCWSFYAGERASCWWWELKPRIKTDEPHDDVPRIWKRHTLHKPRPFWEQEQVNAHFWGAFAHGIRCRIMITSRQLAGSSLILGFLSPADLGTDGKITNLRWSQLGKWIFFFETCGVSVSKMGVGVSQVKSSHQRRR